MGGTQAHPPPLGHCPRDVINLKNAPTLGHSQAPPPPLGHCPCDVIHIFQGWNKIAKGWNKIAKAWNKIAKGWNKIFGLGNWGGVVRPPPPLATGLGLCLGSGGRRRLGCYRPPPPQSFFVLVSLNIPCYLSPPVFPDGCCRPETTVCRAGGN